MSPAVHQFVSADLPAMLTAMFAAVACALVGNFLVLRRMSLMGDAISHAVLPGLVAAFLITGTRSTWPMFIGAAVAGVVTAGLTELVRRVGRVDVSASMGAVFSVMFALGVLMLETAAARSVDLDADCVLNGQLEDVFWLPPAVWSELLTWGVLSELPRELLTCAGMALVAAVFVAVLFKELRIAAFDPALATALGYPAGAMNLAVVVLVAAAAVASFEAVGSILVIGMLICPPAAARMLTDRLATQLWLSAIIAAVMAIGGYVLAGFAPGWLGADRALSASGMITVLGGVMMVLAIVLSPTHGMLARAIRRARLAKSIAREDLLGVLYRLEETRARPEEWPLARLVSAVGGGASARSAAADLVRTGDALRARDGLVLSDSGRAQARTLVRTHRLWEAYLVRELGLRADHTHLTAERLEHVTSTTMRERLAAAADGERDPQGKPIPPEERRGR